jgi:hypothetical protein
METEGQRPVRWLIVAALLLGAAVWYSWTAQRSPERPMAELFDPPPAPDPTITTTAVEVEPRDVPPPPSEP